MVGLDEPIVAAVAKSKGVIDTAAGESAGFAGLKGLPDFGANMRRDVLPEAQELTATDRPRRSRKGLLRGKWARRKAIWSVSTLRPCR